MKNYVTFSSQKNLVWYLYINTNITIQLVITEVCIDIKILIRGCKLAINFIIFLQNNI